MYQEAEEHIKGGMSAGARYTIGFFALLFGVMMFFTAGETKAPEIAIGFGVFCIVIALVCITKGRVRQIFGSIIGVSLFLISAWYLYDMIYNGPLASKKSESSVVNAIMFMIFFGVPGLSYAIAVRFGFAKKQDAQDYEEEYE